MDALCLSGGSDKQKVLAAFACAVFDPSNSSAPVQWHDLPPMTVARRDHAVATVFGKLFALGGVDEGGMPLNSIDVYDSPESRWHLHGVTLLKARFSHSVETFEESEKTRRLYVAGGVLSNGELCDDIEVYRLNANAMEDMEFYAVKSISPRSRFGMVWFAMPFGMEGSGLCLIGGLGPAGPLKTIECYSPDLDYSAGEWNIPTPREVKATVLSDKRPGDVLLIDGGNESAVYFTNESAGWAEVGQLAPHRNHTLATYRGWACCLAPEGDPIITCASLQQGTWVHTQIPGARQLDAHAAAQFSVALPMSQANHKDSGEDSIWKILASVFAAVIVVGMVVWIVSRLFARRRRKMEVDRKKVALAISVATTASMGNSAGDSAGDSVGASMGASVSNSVGALSFGEPSDFATATTSTLSHSPSVSANPVNSALRISTTGDEDGISLDAPAAQTPVGKLLISLRMGRYCQQALEMCIEELSDLGNTSAETLEKELKMFPSHARRLANAVAELASHKRHRSDAESLEEVDYSSILTVRNLGKGSFGTVDQCVWRGTDSAIKTLLDPTRAAEFEKEVRINRRLLLHPHPCVTRMIALATNPRGIIMDLYNLHCVNDYVIKHNNLTEDSDLPKILSILIEASAGVVHLHAHGIVHQDLVARNFLLKSDLSTAVCDFGLSRVLRPGDTCGVRTAEELTQDALPLNSSAPESLSEGLYSPKSDAYMFGTFIWELFARQEPHFDAPEFYHEPPDFSGFVSKVVFQHLRPDLPPSWPPAIVELIKQCWDFHPSRRPSLLQINERLRLIRDACAGMPMPKPIKQPVVVQPMDFYYVPRRLYEGYASSQSPVSPSCFSVSSCIHSIPLASVCSYVPPALNSDGLPPLLKPLSLSTSSSSGPPTPSRKPLSLSTSMAPVLIELSHTV